MLPIPKNIKSIFFAVFLVKSFALMTDLANQQVQFIDSLERFLANMDTVKKFLKNTLSKLVTTVDDENNLNQVISAEYAINCMEK